MAQDLPTLEQSIFQPQQVVSRARGYESIGKMFGQIENAAFEHSISTSKAESKAGLFSSTAMATKAKDEYEVALKADPRPAATKMALENFNSSVKAIEQSAFVNDADRGLLKRQVNVDMASAEKKYAINEIDQARLSQKVSFAADFPLQLQRISQDILSNPDLAQDAIQTSYDTLKAALETHVLTPAEFEKYNGLLTTTMERSYMMIERMGQLDAHGYHKETAFTPAGQKPNSPRNAITGGLNDNLVSEYNYQDVIAGVQTGNLDNGAAMYAISKLSPDQFSKMLLAMDGVSEAEGYINSGHPYEAIKERVDYLNSRKSSTLTTSEEAERDRLSTYITDMQHNYIDTVRSTPQGGAMTADYLRNITAIQNNVTLTPEQRQDMLGYEANRYMSELINYGHAMGVPAQYIKPVDMQTAADVQGAFNLGADPQIALSRLGNLTKTNAAYVAASMKYPNQKQTLMTAVLLGKDNSGMKETFITANQEGLSFKGLEFGKDSGTTEAQLNAKIATKLAGTAQYLARSGGDEQRGTGLNQMAINTVKYMALKNGDLQLKNIDSYVAQVTGSIEKAYNIQDGSFYSFNASQQQLSGKDAYALANYVRDEVVMGMDKNISKEQMLINQDLNPLFVSMNEAGLVNVTDSTGTTVWQAPYTPSMLNAARAFQAPKDLELSQQVEAVLPKFKGAVQPEAGTQDFASLRKEVDAEMAKTKSVKMSREELRQAFIKQKFGG